MSKKLLMGVVAVLTALLLFTMVVPAFAVDNPDEFFDPETSGGVADNFRTASNTIIGVVQVVGTAVAIVMLIWLGIKYVIAAPDEKANIKQSAFIYIIAAVFIFAASNILAILQRFSQDITK